MKTIRQFIDEHHLAAKIVQIYGRPDLDDDIDVWARKATHWCVTLTHTRSANAPKFTVLFSQGEKAKRSPSITDVLDNLKSSIVHEQTFENYCSDFGYDNDSRSAERSYHACVEQTQRLRKFLGQKLFREFMEEVSPD